MFALNRFVITFVLLVKIFNYFIALSNGVETTTPSFILGPGHAIAGNYSWNSINNCGLNRIPNQSLPRIVDGFRAELGEFPWMATMFVELRGQRYREPLTPVCSAVIISDYWLLTAKHCFRGIATAKWIGFYVGSEYKYQASSIHEYAERFDAVDESFTSQGLNDISLVRVRTRIPTQTTPDKRFRVNKVCIPVSDIMNNKSEDAVFSGFGNIDKNGSKQSWVLRKTQYVIEPPKECQKLVNTTDFKICAMVDKHIDCFVDSGGALIQFDGNRAVLIGILGGHESVKEFPCAGKWNQFTRVSKFVTWIQEIIEKDTTKDWTFSPPPSPPANTPKWKPPVPSPAEKAVSDIPLETTTGSNSKRLTYKTISLIIPMVLILNIFI